MGTACKLHNCNNCFDRSLQFGRPRMLRGHCVFVVEDKIQLFTRISSSSPAPSVTRLFRSAESHPKRPTFYGVPWPTFVAETP